MNNSFRKKLLMYSLTSIFLLSFLAVHPTNAYDPTQGWTVQATGCNAVSGNINGIIDNVYLGVGQTVPSSIKAQYPQATSGFLEDWKTNMVGMSANQFKSFIIPASQGYTTPGAQLYGKDLFFEVTILIIYNVGSTGLTTRNSVVKVQYSLYTDCQVASSYPDTNTGTGTTTTTSAIANIKPAPPNYTGIIVGGGLVGVVVLAAVGYVVMNGRKTNISTDKIIKETRQKETQNIQSLKESLLPNKNNLPKTSTIKQSKTRRRR